MQTLQSIPIKDILLGNLNVQQLEEFEFIRNNPILSTLGAAAIGGTIANDYHNHDYHSVGKYIGDKMDTVRNTLTSGIDKTKSVVHDATKPAINTTPIAHRATSNNPTI